MASPETVAAALDYLVSACVGLFALAIVALMVYIVVAILPKIGGDTKASGEIPPLYPDPSEVGERWADRHGKPTDAVQPPDGLSDDAPSGSV